MYILGVSCYYHDSAACLLRNGDLVCAAAEERFTRVKHDFSFPANAINFCLESEEITGEDIEFVVFYEKPFLKFERIIKTILSTYPRSYKLFNQVVINWLKDKLWIKYYLAEFLEVSGEKIKFSEHHLSHAAAAFFSSPFKDAAILTIDGVGEWATTTLGIGKANWGDGGQNEIKILEEMRFPHSLGLLYSVFTAFLGFRVNNGEYKVMGLSSFGEPKCKDKIYQLIKINPDGSFKLNMKYFSYHYSTKYSFNKNFIKLFGKPRRPDSQFTEDKIQENKRFVDIAASIQEVTENIIIKMANYLYQKTKLKKLCLAGGVVLNCKTNYKVLKNTPFQEIFIQPAAGDGGGALGAALYLWHSSLNKKRRFILSHISWGKSYSHREIKVFLDKKDIDYEEFLNKSSLLNYVVEALINQKIIGWFQGRFEWGARALGNRSILADPRDIAMKNKINQRIKYRESFRPFGPSVIYEKTNLLFDIEDIKNQYPFRFMLYTIPVKNNCIPAATHIDNSCRIQIVDRNTFPLYYKLISKFYKKTGVPVVLNTSFNLKGEPIVNTPQDAFNTFEKSGMDLLILGNFVIKK